MAPVFFSVLLSTSTRAFAWGTQRSSRSFRRKGAAILGGGAALLSAAGMGCNPQLNTVDPEQLIVDIQQYMANPINDIPTLENSPEMKHKMEVLCMQLQGKLCKELEKIEGVKKFEVDRWLKCGKSTKKRLLSHEADAACHDPVWESSAWPCSFYNKNGYAGYFEGTEGGGVTCVMEDGAVFERAGVNISVVTGRLRAAAVKQMNSRGRNLPEDEEMSFNAVGISSVIHPRNPKVPTMHFNFRYFEVNPEMSEKQWWFGGGSDLTPYYLDNKDAKHFHCTWKNACDLHGPTYYKRFKKWCDDYFYLSHRLFRRGIGGIFFDDFVSSGPENAFGFVKECAGAVIPSYIPIVNKHKNDNYGIREREWQLLRRGQYVEFNLIHDRGTKFGFHTPGARIESILVSMPPLCTWKYCYEPEPGSEEAKLMAVLKNPVEWVTV